VRAECVTKGTSPLRVLRQQIELVGGLTEAVALSSVDSTDISEGGSSLDIEQQHPQEVALTLSRTHCVDATDDVRTLPSEVVLERSSSGRGFRGTATGPYSQ